MSDNHRFSSLRTIKTAKQHLLARPDKVFPLLCPTREYEWIETWKCRVVHSQSGCAELDCVFVTDFPGEGEDVWVVSVYRPNEEIGFVRSNGRRTIRFSITLTDNGDGTTTAVWTQVFTGLNEDGNRMVQSVTDEGYRQRILERERQLNHFLTTGTMLKATG
jgi:hypothetical protein